MGDRQSVMDVELAPDFGAIFHAQEKAALADLPE